MYNIIYINIILHLKCTFIKTIKKHKRNQCKTLFFKIWQNAKNYRIFYCNFKKSFQRITTGSYHCGVKIKKKKHLKNLNVHLKSVCKVMKKKNVNSDYE